MTEVGDEGVGVSENVHGEMAMWREPVTSAPISSMYPTVSRLRWARYLPEWSTKYD